MAKAYWIAHVTVTDPDNYSLYANGAPKAFEKYGAKILARGGAFEQLEGKGHTRNVVIEFASMQDALNCYHSKEYQSAKEHRENAGIAEIVIVEGV
ncbi:DUF1330 domain-containing protein [Sneathiella glossodoripedis]|uniref:DUF1330 domain-containing protein n=1 Tax=Sneathiella glossodoripedis TaxID=418853 RepID=UPI0004721787|nr:DUF1330 domain-containing protein [Sneathiella glossodoripedis]